MLQIKTTGYQDFIDGSGNLKMMVIGAGDSGKGHPLDTAVLAPTGWVELGKLQVGDEVIGSDGRPTEVTAIYDRGILPVRRVTFNDATSVLVDPEHLWRVRDHHGNWQTIETRALGSLVRQAAGNSLLKWIIPTVGPVQHPHAALPLHPYVLGALLGNGRFAVDHVQLTVAFGPEWESHIAAIESLTPGWMQVKEVTRKRNATARQFHLHDCLPVMRELGLIGVLSREKFIPRRYLHADVEQRRALLAGLMDTDGGMRSPTSAWYYTISPRLAADVAELVRSLGGWAAIAVTPRTDKPTEHHVKVRVRDNPFWLGPKPARWSSANTRDLRHIASVTDEGHAEIRCLAVAAADQLYVVENHIVTHNTRMASFFPRPFYLDCENGRGSLSDRAMPYVEVKRSQDALDALAYLRSLEGVPKPERPYQTVVLDTLDSFQRLVKDEWLQDTKEGVFRGFDAWGFLDSKIGMLLTRLLNLDYNVLVLVHYKDKQIKDEDGNESREFMLQLQGDIKETIFNDFGLVGWLGTYWEIDGDRGRVERRGLTFHKTPDKPMLKDRFAITPRWFPITFTEHDYEQIYLAFLAKMEEREMPDATVLGEVPRAETIPAENVAAPPAGGPVAPVALRERPLHSLSKPELIEVAAAEGVSVRGNALKAEIMAAIGSARTRAAARAAEQQAEQAEASPQPPPNGQPARAEPEGLADPFPLAAEPVDQPVPDGAPTVESVAAAVSGTVLSERTGPPAAPAAPASDFMAGMCNDCGKALRGEVRDYVRLSFIKHRRGYLCGDCFQKANGAGRR